MNGREFAKYLARDLHCPCGCQGAEDTYVPQHRRGRQMGGSTERHTPSNIIVMCSEANGRIDTKIEVGSVVSDRLSLEQVIGNLFDNAVKYRAKERPLRLQVSSFALPDGQIAIEVADNGRASHRMM